MGEGAGVGEERVAVREGDRRVGVLRDDEGRLAGMGSFGASGRQRTKRIA